MAAALAAATLGSSVSGTGVSLVCCRVTGFENLAYLKAVVIDLVGVPVSDLDDARAEAFTARCREHWPDLKSEVAPSVEETLSAHRLVCLATTTVAPHPTTDACRRGTLVLHVSRRDLTPGRGP
ncbi:hypothetical protein [Streptomyces rubradiris]|uniref:Uncharacterized protein n=1 Tax=Streptomyces rubradiris TaxID=285531 RepID=A0ABQ3R8D9_STRRR|nr:hypothetical protein [Streptomyces rubradiris]GHH23087.1 hypothetical protein GCM10018792_59370 [Streptomyces rubradiris]GHI52117.1 hypothetical protein Srubr_19630 [Streptomyces rubradiris]